MLFLFKCASMAHRIKPKGFDLRIMVSSLAETFVHAENKCERLRAYKELLLCLKLHTHTKVMGRKCPSSEKLTSCFAQSAELSF